MMNAGEVVCWLVLRSAAMQLECINGYLAKLLHLGIKGGKYNNKGSGTFWT